MKPDTTTADLTKRVCRLITEDSEVLSDELWEKKWAWHTDPESIRLGGPWSTMTAAHKIIELVRSDARN